MLVYPLLVFDRKLTVAIRNQKDAEKTSTSIDERPKDAKSPGLRDEGLTQPRRRPRETLSSQPAHARFSSPVLSTHSHAPSRSSHVPGGEQSRPASARSAKSLPTGTRSSLAAPRPAQRRTSPLSMNPLEPEIISVSGQSGDTKSMSRMPSLPSLDTLMKYSQASEASREASPQDIEATRPKTAEEGRSRPRSYLPRLQFPGDLLADAFTLPSSMSVLQEDSSIFTESPVDATPTTPTAYDTTSAPLVSESPILPKTQLASRTDPPQRPMSQNPRKERPSSRRLASREDIPVPPIPKTFSMHQDSTDAKPALVESQTPQTPQSAIERASIYQTARKSKSTPQLVQIPATHRRIDSSPSSMKSSDTQPSGLSAPHSRSHSAGPTHIRNRSITSHAPSSTTSPSPKPSRSRRQSPLRPRNSIQRHQVHIRKSSSTLNLTERRHSKERDQLPYDPTSSHRTRSGSIQGRTVDFDVKRESPFLDAAPVFPTPATTGEAVKSKKSASGRPSLQVRQSTWPLLHVDTSVEQKSSEVPISAVDGIDDEVLPEPPKIQDVGERPISAASSAGSSPTLGFAMQMRGGTWPKEGQNEKPDDKTVKELEASRGKTNPAPSLSAESSQNTQTLGGVYTTTSTGDLTKVPSLLVPGKRARSQSVDPAKKPKGVELSDSSQASLKQVYAGKENRPRGERERRIDLSRARWVGNGEGLELFDFFDS